MQIALVIRLVRPLHLHEIPQTAHNCTVNAETTCPERQTVCRQRLLTPRPVHRCLTELTVSVHLQRTVIYVLFNLRCNRAYVRVGSGWCRFGRETVTHDYHTSPPHNHARDDARFSNTHTTIKVDTDTTIRDAD